MAHTKDEALKLALKALKNTYALRDDVVEAITAINQALEAPAKEENCNPHPKAPHGFNRSASHNASRYVCECEGWDAHDAGYQEGAKDAYKRIHAIDKTMDDELEALFTNIDHAISSGAWNVQKGSQTWEVIEEAKAAHGITKGQP